MLSGLAAILFLYLAVIPAGLVASTVDSACAGGGCETSLISRAGFSLLYGACTIALVGSALLFANHALRYTASSQDRLVSFLALTGAVVGATLFILFFVAFPVGGLVALAIAGATLLTLLRRRGRGSEPDVSGNGHREGELPLGTLPGRAPR